LLSSIAATDPDSLRKVLRKWAICQRAQGLKRRSDEGADRQQTGGHSVQALAPQFYLGCGFSSASSFGPLNTLPMECLVSVFNRQTIQPCFAGQADPLRVFTQK